MTENWRAFIHNYSSKLCSNNINKEEWAKYPAILDLCKMCKSFQAAINNTIDEQADKIGIITDFIKTIKK
jgi:hypothetical protein